jgi:hypothetical protein
MPEKEIREELSCSGQRSAAITMNQHLARRSFILKENLDRVLASQSSQCPMHWGWIGNVCEYPVQR